eukprot:9315634-Pyramimonas_sp.AAC.1
MNILGTQPTDVQLLRVQMFPKPSGDLRPIGFVSEFGSVVLQNARSSQSVVGEIGHGCQGVLHGPPIGAPRTGSG